MKRPIIFLLSVFLLLAACAGKEDLSESALTAYMPEGALSVYTVPSYRTAISEIFSMAAVAFGKESSVELKDKIFSILSWQWKLPLLDEAGIRRLGLSDNRPVLAAAYQKGGFYVSVPLSDSVRVIDALKKRFPGLKRVPEEKPGIFDLLLEEKTLFRITANRLYVFYNEQNTSAREMVRPGPTKGRAPSGTFTAKSGFLAWFSTHSLTEAGIPLLSMARSPAIVGYSRKGRHVLVQARLLNRMSDPFSSLFRKNGLGDLVPLFEWMPPGYGLAPAADSSDLLVLQAGISRDGLWNRLVYPMLRNALKDRLGSGGSIFTKLMGRERLLSIAISTLNIKKGLLDLLTGRVMFRLHSFTGIPTQKRLTPILDSFDGALLIETKGTNECVAAVKKLASLTKRVGIRLQEREKEGFTYYAMPLYRLGILAWLYLSVQKDVLVLSWKEKHVIARSNGNRPAGTGFYAVTGALAGTLRTRPVRYLLSISISRLIDILGTKLDWKTRANLSPITRQIAVLPRVTTVLSRAEGIPVLSADLTLNRIPPAVDPFETKGDSSDPVLWGLGGFFLLLILLSVGRWTYKKVKYRN